MTTKIRIAALLAVALFPLTLTAQGEAVAPRQKFLTGDAVTQRVAGLEQPVEILRDRWGIAHIYAQTEHDLFFAQGYNAARDRLFQFELWRLQATGTAAAIFGEKELKRDIGARLHRYRGDLNQELTYYHPNGVAIVDAFVAGVNAYIAATERDPALLPMEFGLLGIKPQRWTPAVVISRHQGLLANLTSEVALAKLISSIGPERVRKLQYFQGGDPVLQADPALDLAALPDNVLELYTAFRQPVKFDPQYIVAAHRNDRQSYQQLAANLAEDMLTPKRDIGSNNWIIHGSRTENGYPLMANDPHRAITVPSLRYWVHLVGPGWNVIGGGEPVLPGVSIGHNEHGAWGLTIFGSDNEDLYVYDTDPANPNAYKYQGRWEPMRIEHDKIAVKGRPAVAVTYKFTRHGPVLFEDTKAHKAYALRAAWLEQGGAPYLASLRMDQARTWEEFRAACAHNHIPAESMIWADRAGNIGFQATGIRPLRPNWQGLLPVPGDGRYEWNGFLPIKSLPHEFNPAKGFWVTANNYLMPRDFKFPQAMTYQWAESFRADRIEELLGGGRRFNIAEVALVQNDELSLPARRLVPLLQDVSISDTKVAAARDLLVHWNAVLAKESTAAGLYSVWQRKLLDNFKVLILGESLAAASPTLHPSMKRMIDQLYAPDGDFGADSTAGRDALLVRSLEQAVAQLSKDIGPDMTQWRYGQEKLHHVLIHHPLSPAVREDIRKQLEVGTAPRGGDEYTIVATGSGNQQAGGSFKIIADTEDWDNSVGQNTPGQSGDVRSPHYRDLFTMWAQGKYFPAAYSRAKVESVTAERHKLMP